MTDAPRRRRGRSKGARNRATLVREIGAELQVVPFGDETRIITNVDYVLMALRERAMLGDLPALKALEDFAVRLGASEGTCVLLAREGMSAGDWLTQQEAKNKDRKPPAKASAAHE